jgi:hypothetical protein
MRYLLLIIVSFYLLLSGCSRHDCCFNYDTGIQIFVENKSGQNLLDKNTPGYFDTDAIFLSYILDGKAKRISEGHLDCPNKVCVIAEQGMKYLLLYPNESENEAFPLTILHWNETDADTIRCSFIRSENSISCSHVWCNDIAVFPEQARPRMQRAFTIVK